MRFEFDINGYVSGIFCGCYSGHCTEYTGLVPNEPEAYEDMYDWADRAQVQAYYLDSNGNLAYDANRAASLCPEDEVVPIRYTAEKIKEMGIFDAIYPVGSLYMSANNVNPSILFGGTWVQIEDRFILAAGTKYSGGDESASGIPGEVNIKIPEHKHLTPLVKKSNYLGFWTDDNDDASKSVTASDRIIVSGSTFSDSATATTYYTGYGGAYEKKITIPPTLPPYLAVFVWQRVENPIPENYQRFIDRSGNKFADADELEFIVEVN